MKESEGVKVLNELKIAAEVARSVLAVTLHFLVGF